MVFQKLTVSSRFRAETGRFSKIVGSSILPILNILASVAALIRRLIIDTALSVLQVWRFEQLLTQCVPFVPRRQVLQVWRFEQLLTTCRRAISTPSVLQVWRFEQLLTITGVYLR